MFYLAFWCFISASGNLAWVVYFFEVDFVKAFLSVLPLIDLYVVYLRDFLRSCKNVKL